MTPTPRLDAALFSLQSLGLTALKQTTNEEGGYKYANLMSVMDTVRHPLNEHGILIRFGVSGPGETGVLVVTLRLIHKDSGESCEESLSLKIEKAHPQTIGSAITYFSRYLLVSMLNVVTDDDDGEAARTTERKKKDKGEQAGKVKGEGGGGASGEAPPRGGTVTPLDPETLRLANELLDREEDEKPVGGVAAENGAGEVKEPEWTAYARWFEKDGCGHYESLDRAWWWSFDVRGWLWNLDSVADGKYAAAIDQARSSPPTFPPYGWTPPAQPTPAPDPDGRTDLLALVQTWAGDGASLTPSMGLDTIKAIKMELGIVGGSKKDNQRIRDYINRQMAQGVKFTNWTPEGTAAER